MQDYNIVIARLCELFPKTFFNEPRLRRPLKVNIVSDIEKLNEPSLANCNIGAVVNWYTGHIGYDYCFVAGAERIDLNGKVAGKITEKEAREARARIASKHKGIDERRNPNRVARSLHGTGGFTDDQMKKIPPPETNNLPVNPIDKDFEAVFVAMNMAREQAAQTDSALRTAMVKAALSVATTTIANILRHFEASGDRLS
jgi:sRNA-binding protein